MLHSCHYLKYFVSVSFHQLGSYVGANSCRAASNGMADDLGAMISAPG